MAINLYALDTIQNHSKAIAALENYADQIIDEFLDAPEGIAYINANPDEEDYVGEWFLTILELAYETEAITLPHITPVLITTVLTQRLPSVLTPEEAQDVDNLIPELIAFWSFLDRAYRLSVAPGVLKALQKLKPSFKTLLRGGTVTAKTPTLSSSVQRNAKETVFKTNRAHKSATNETTTTPDSLLTGALSALNLGNGLSRSSSLDFDIDDIDFDAEMQQLEAELAAEREAHGGEFEFDPDELLALEQNNSAQPRQAKQSATTAKTSQVPASTTPTLKATPADERSLSVSPDAIAILAQQTLTDTVPGPILHDFQVLLDAIGKTGDKGMAVSSKTKQIPMKMLAELNRNMTAPIQLGLKRPSQKAYGNIHGLVLLLQSSGLGQLTSRGKKDYWTLNPDRIARWHALSPTDQYCTLLHRWLLSPEATLDGQTSSRTEIDLIIGAWSRIFPPDQVTFVDKSRHSNRILLSFHSHNLALLRSFGLLNLQEEVPKEGQGWQVKALQQTEFGQVLMAEIIRLYCDHLLNFDIHPESASALQTFLQTVLQTCFPSWSQSLDGPLAPLSPLSTSSVSSPSVPVSDLSSKQPVNAVQAKQSKMQAKQSKMQAKQNKTTGVYVFNVTLDEAQRWIAISSDQTLFELGRTILDAVNFDSDHLDVFRYTSPDGVMVEICHPDSQGERSTDEVLIGELGLSVGATLIYIFDLGQNWRFSLSLESIDTQDLRTGYVELIDAQGDAPDQYSGLDIGFDDGDW